MLHIQIVLDDAFPSSEELATRNALIAMLSREVGRVGDTGAGGGVIDLWVTVEDWIAATAKVAAIARSLGIEERVRTIDDPALPPAELPTGDEGPPPLDQLPEAHPATAEKLLAMGRVNGHLTYDQVEHLIPAKVVHSAALDAWMLMLGDAGLEILPSEDDA